MSKNKKIINDSPTTQVFALIQESISAVLTENERIDIKDATDEEFQEFIESMTQDQFTKIREYIELIPKLSHTVNYECTSCNKNNSVLMEGLQSFL